jgi:signal transduction histidine kinase
VADSQSLYESILNSMTEGFVIQDKSGAIIEFNQAATKVLGVSEDQLRGKISMDPDWNAIKEDGSEFPGHEHPSMLVLSTGKPQDKVIMGVRRGTQNPKWIQIYSRPFLKSADAKDWVALTTFSDVTDLVQQRQQSQELNQRFLEAEKVAKIGSWSFDLKTQKIIWSNQLFEIFKLESKQEAPSFEAHLTMIDPKDRENYLATIQKGLAAGVRYKVRYRIISGGTSLWVEGIGNPVKNRLGETIGLFGTCQDITDQVVVEEENRLIIEALGLGVWKFSPKTNELHWDESMYRLYGVSQNEFSGHYEAWESQLSAETKAQAVSDLQSALRGEKEFNTMFEVVSKSGEKRMIGARAFVKRNDAGEPLQMIGINWDRSKEAQLQRELEIEKAKSLQNAKLASLGEMSAGVAHEINNPLGIISGTAVLLQKHIDDPLKLAPKIEIIEKATARIAKIVSGLKKFSRNTDKKEFRVMELEPLVAEALGMLESKRRRSDIHIATISAATKTLVNCDEVEIGQVILNLVNNAIDAISSLPEKWIKIEFENRPSSVVLKITDSGSGIPDDVASKMFNPFFTTKKVGEGTGLGLAIVKGILDEHKATIQLQRSSPNTCFEIEFPRVMVSDVA